MNLNKKVLTDPVFILLFLNSLMVLLAYSYNSYYQAISGTFTLVKQFLILASIFYLLTQKISLGIFRSSTLLIPITFLFFSALRTSFLSSIYSLSTLFIPYFYLLFSLSYLVIHYEFKTTFAHLLILINAVYLYPVLIYYIFGSGFEKTNIYGIQENGFFYSNHYGWASTVFLTTAPAILYLFNPGKLYRNILLGSIILAFYLLIISANRASFLAISIALMVLLLYPKGIQLLKKNNLKLLPFLILIPAYFLISIKDQKGSAIEFLIAKNEKQFETKEMEESRLVVTDFSFRHFNEQPLLWFTGVGLFNHSFIEGVTNLGAYHNSYWEILFGGGVFAFFFFLNVMVFRPFYVFKKYIGNFGLVIIPLVIIPFFESNLTGGQFLFFPWFSVMLLLNVRKID
jgi:hypothetical protein